MLRGSPGLVRRPVSTVVLTARDQHTLDELECVAAATVRVLTQALQAGEGLAHGATWVVAGAGCAEAYLGHELRKLVHLDGAKSLLPGATASVRRSVHRAIVNYAECLEIAGGLRTPGAATRVTQQWMPEHLVPGQSEDAQRPLHCYGWTGTDAIRVMASRRKGDDERVLVADSECVLDSLGAKLAALSTACEVANCLLRVDTAIEG
jgi:chaperonin GroEL (HSP60 family)